MRVFIPSTDLSKVKELIFSNYSEGSYFLCMIYSKNCQKQGYFFYSGSLYTTGALMIDCKSQKVYTANCSNVKEVI